MDDDAVDVVERASPAPVEEENPMSKEERRKLRQKKRLMKEAAKAANRGVCYLSRVPPRMDHLKLRHILSPYGELGRIYLAPETAASQINRKRAGGFRGQGFSEGWVEFMDKRIAKKVANMLNSEQIGGRKRSQFYYDIWNIKYLSKFKWDDLTEEIAYKSAIREQKQALEISAAKRERDFYLRKVDRSRALTNIEERINKRQKLQENDSNPKPPVNAQGRVFHHIPQTQPVADKSATSKTGLSKDFLSKVFGGSS